MARVKMQTPEQVLSILRQVEVSVASGKTTALASKEAVIAEQTYDRWRKGVRQVAGRSGNAAEGA
jgi:putative transposase